MLKKRDFQRLVNLIKEFQSKLPCSEISAELRDSLNLALLHMHKFYKRARIRSHTNGGNTLESSISLSTSLTGAASPMSPYISPIDRFDWRWLNLDVDKLSASFGHGDKTNFVPEIFYVIKDCDLDQLEKMVTKDEDIVNELDAIGRTTAMYATNGGTTDYLQCLKFLVGKGADLQHQSNDGFTCLHMACCYGYREFVAEIIESKVELDSQDSEGRTPLHFAAANCSQDNLQMLIVNGADPNIQDNEGLTPAMWACHFDQLENLQLLLAIEEKANQPPEARYHSVDNVGRTILHWAVTKTSNVSCMKYLLNAETAQLCDDEGKTIFLFAAEHGCVSACEEVLSICGEEALEDMDNFGRTALHLALLGGHGEVVELLLNKGAAPDRFDSQGVAPIDLITSRKLNYCHLVFTSYQRYRERLASMQANLGGTVNEGNVEDQNSPNEAQNVETEKCNSFEYNGVEKVYEEDEEAKERRDPDAEEGSVKMDCQGAVGFEIEGDIDEDAEFDIANVNRSHMSGGSNSKTTLKEVDELKPAATIESRDGSRNGENNEIKEEKEGKEKSHKLQKADRVVNDVVEEGENEAEIETTDAQRPDAEKEGAEKEGTEKEGAEKEGAEKGVQEVDSEANDSPIEEIEIGEDSKEEEYDFEDVSIGVGGQKIVLVAHHEGDNGFEVAFGNDINDLEFQEDEDNEEAPGDNSDDHQKSSGDVLRADDGYDRDLSPRVESVTGLLESNTAHANQSVSINMSVASLRSDSDDEEAAVPSRKERISKLDSKIPTFEDRPTNQLEFRDPFAKAKPFPNLDDSDSLLKRNEDSRQKSGKRKDKRDNSKSKLSLPKEKQQQGLKKSSPRMHLGSLEPMKPLQPIIPSQGIQGSRDFHGAAYDSQMPSSPRSPFERSNRLPSPSDSPRSKGSQLPSPRSGFDGRGGKLSHIPRPSSPSSRDRHLPMASSNVFPPGPPIGR